MVAWISIACTDDAIEQSRLMYLDAGDDAAPSPARGAAAPDLRFKWVGSAFGVSRMQSASSFLLGANASHGAVAYQAQTPMQLSVQVADTADAGADHADAGAFWALAGLRRYAVFTPAPAVELLHRIDKGGSLERLDRDLAELFAQNLVVSSLDFAELMEEGRYGLLAATPNTSKPRYVGLSTSLAREHLSEWVASEAAQSHVVTALGGAGDELRVISYGRDGDRDTYETQVREVEIGSRQGLEKFEENARALADQGYILTAFGRAGATFLLVGTRKAGETAQRSLSTSTQRHPPLEQGYAIVAWLQLGESSFAVLEN
jgi:hypothetical protein